MHSILHIAVLLPIVLPCSSLHDRPVVGILAQETYDSLAKYGDSYMYSAYVKFMEQAGALVAPIRINETEEYYTDLFTKINGVIFPGGGADLLTSGYAKAGKLLTELAIKANDAGDYFPLLGICLGFQLMTANVLRADLLVKCDGENYPLALNFTPDIHTSRLFGKAPADVLYSLKNWNITFNNHQYCMTPHVFNNSKALRDFYRVLSTNYAHDGKEFISTMEAHKYPFYGVQWHPAKNLYYWALGSNINHSADAVLAAQYIANFFVGEARKNNHHFPSNEAMSKSLSFNYNPVYMGLPSFHDIYFFSVPEHKQYDRRFRWFSMFSEDDSSDSLCREMKSPQLSNGAMLLLVLLMIMFTALTLRAIHHQTYPKTRRFMMIFTQDDNQNNEEQTVKKVDLSKA